MHASSPSAASPPKNVRFLTSPKPLYIYKEVVRVTLPGGLASATTASATEFDHTAASQKPLQGGGGADRAEELFVVERLGEKCRCSSLERSAPHQRIVASRKNQDSGLGRDLL